MKRLLSFVLLTLSFAAGCKTSSRSRLDSLYWSRGDFSYFVAFNGSAFLVSKCHTTPELQKAVAVDKDASGAQKLCNEQVTIITPMAMKDAITDALLGSPSDDLVGTKVDRIKQLQQQIQILQDGIDKIAAELDQTDFEPMRSAMQSTLNQSKVDLSKAQTEMKDLTAALSDPSKLKQIDINSTLALQTELVVNAANQAAIFTAMLKAVTIYNLDPNRDSILIGAVEKFPASCVLGLNVDKSVTADIGIERVQYACGSNGYPTIQKTSCGLDGYSRMNDYCVFTGKNLSLSNLVATESGVCGAAGSGMLTCWGTAGSFPMVINALSNGTMLGSDSSSTNGLTSRILASRIAGSGRRLCTLASGGAIMNCWPNISFPGSGDRFTQIVGGDAHLCGLTAEGAVKCWGDNTYHQLSVPTGLTGVQTLSTMENATCAIDGSNAPACWGDVFGPTTLTALTPPSDIKDILALSTGTRHACVLLKNQNVRCWGVNDAGQTSVPSDLGVVRSITAARYESCAVTDDGNLKCWGTGPSDLNYQAAPSLQSVKKVVASRWGANLCAIYGSTSKVACWGSQKYSDSYSIAPPSDLAQVQDIVITTSGYACAIINDGTVRCWGNSKNVPSGVPAAFTVTKS